MTNGCLSCVSTFTGFQECEQWCGWGNEPVCTWGPGGKIFSPGEFQFHEKCKQRNCWPNLKWRILESNFSGCDKCKWRDAFAAPAVSKVAFKATSTTAQTFYTPGWSWKIQPGIGFNVFYILKDTTRNGFSPGTEIHANAAPPSRFYNGETETESENRFTQSGGFQRLFRDESSPHPYLKQFKGKSFSETKAHPILYAI